MTFSLLVMGLTLGGCVGQQRLYLRAGVGRSALGLGVREGAAR